MVVTDLSTDHKFNSVSVKTNKYFISSLICDQPGREIDLPDNLDALTEPDEKGVEQGLQWILGLGRLVTYVGSNNSGYED